MGRLVWASVILGLFLHLRYVLRSCSRDNYVNAFVSLSVALILLTVVVEVGIMVGSLTGSIVETESESATPDHVLMQAVQRVTPLACVLSGRDHVPRLIGFHFVLGGLQVVLAIGGLMIVADPGRLIACSQINTQDHVYMIIALISISQLVDVCLKCCCCLALAGAEVEDDMLPLYERQELVQRTSLWQVSLGRALQTAALFHAPP
jgi:hypothetical protein